MIITLRLQGLDVRAGTKDIRKFFKGLYIPEGGVYIVGGRLKEAFIAFTTEKDAQLAMQYSGKVLKGSKVTLHISSMAELEHKLKYLLKKIKMMKRKKRKGVSSTQQEVGRSQPSPDASLPPLNPLPSAALPHDPRITKHPEPLYSNTANVPTSDVNLLDPNTAFLLGICTVLQGLQSSNENINKEIGPTVNFSKAQSATVVSDVEKTPEKDPNSTPGYVRLFGLPASTTKEEICNFFRGLSVQEVIVNVKLGLGHGCLVKFANMQDASDALSFNKQPLGPICVEVRGATEKMWTSALQECENAFDGGKIAKPPLDPLRETANPKQNPTQSLQRINQLQHKSNKRPRLDCDSATTFTPTKEYIIMARNLPNQMTKTELKELFGCPNIAHKNVLHLLDKEGNRTDTAFLIFDRIDDSDYAINLSGCHVGGDTIEVSPITKEKMREMMAHMKKPNQKRKMHPAGTVRETSEMDTDSAAQTCLFVRNMPADVKMHQIKTLFDKYKLRDDNIILLRDSNGNGIGEAVVNFKSQKLAALAYRLNGQNFLGTKVLLTCINVSQMEAILAQSA